MPKGFQKNHKLGKGRPKGSKNIATLEKRGLIEFVKGEGLEQFLRELQTLEGEKYCKIFKDIIETAFPKLNRTEITGANGKDLIPLDYEEFRRKYGLNAEEPATLGSGVQEAGQLPVLSDELSEN